MIMCQDRGRLLETCEQWEETFSGALGEHCSRLAMVDKETYQGIRDAVEVAAVGLNNAKAALRAHEAEHGCS